MKDGFQETEGTCKVESIGDLHVGFGLGLPALGREELILIGKRTNLCIEFLIYHLQYSCLEKIPWTGRQWSCSSATVIKGWT